MEGGQRLHTSRAKLSGCNVTGVSRFNEYIYTKDKIMGFVFLVFIECQSCPSAVS